MSGSALSVRRQDSATEPAPARPALSSYNEVSAPGLSSRSYFNRHTEDALDLCDVISSFAAHTKASLNELSKIMGMPGKPNGIDGTEVV